jgi:rhodanese-related sulfurtransferase
MRKAKIASTTLCALILVPFMLVLPAFATSDLTLIDTAQLHSMIVDNAYKLEGGREKQFTVVDAREKEEYSEAHIFSAISIPEKEFERSTALLPKDKGVQLVVYCNDSKFGTSAKWAIKAAAHGYTNVVIYSEGFSTWKARHMPTAPL